MDWGSFVLGMAAGFALCFALFLVLLFGSLRN